MILFGSRGSELALTQTRMIAQALHERTGEACRIEIFETKGDRVQDQPLPEIGGKGLFTAELEAALRQGTIDAAVHSLKDLPVADPDGLCVAAVPPRAAAADVLVYAPGRQDRGDPRVPLQRGCRVGTSSHRRRAALLRLRPDLQLADVRGNVPTRVAKVYRGDYDAVVLAAAGLDRLHLDLGGLRRIELPPDLCAPAPAQGALAVQCRSDDQRMRALLAALHDEATARCVDAERELLALLGGGCSMPLGAFVRPQDGGGFRLQAALFGHPGQQPDADAGAFLDLQGADPRALVRAAASELAPLVGAPLLGRRIVLLRPEGSGGELAQRLGVAGAAVQSVALTRLVPLQRGADGLRELVRDRALCFTSARAAEHFFALARDVDLDGVPVFAAGPATAAAVRAFGLACASPAEGTGGAALARCVAAAGAPPRGVLFPCAEEHHGDLEAGLAAAGIAVAALPLYRCEALAAAAVRAPAGAVLVFTSPSAVRAYATAHRASDAHCVALGPTTAQALRAAGLPCAATAATATAGDLVRAIRELSHV